MSCDWVPEVRVLFQHLSFRENFSGNDVSERRLTIVQKGGKAIEVGESSRRPFNPHRSRQGLNAGVPQVSSQRTT
jgi:hypothetical protein